MALLLLLVLRRVAGRKAMSRVGLSWGTWREWLRFAVAIVAFYVLQVVLNALFGLGPVHSSSIPVPPKISPRSVRASDRDGIDPGGTNPGTRHCFRRRVRLAGISAKRTLNDQTAGFIVFLGYKPLNPAFSFGVSIYGIATLALITLLILRTPVWRGRGSSLIGPSSGTDQVK